MLQLCEKIGLQLVHRREAGAENALPCEAPMDPAPSVEQNGIPSAISREDMAKLAIRRYEGRVRLVATPGDLEEAQGDLRQEAIVGLDTETRPAFKKGESHLPCLVQAATARAVYLFQLRRTEVFPVVAELLSDPRSVKAGVSLADDLRLGQPQGPGDPGSGLARDAVGGVLVAVAQQDAGGLALGGGSLCGHGLKPRSDT